MATTRPSLRRAVAVCILVVVSGALIGPAFGAEALTKRRVKKIATRVAQQVVMEYAYSKGEADSLFLQDDLTRHTASTPFSSTPNLRQISVACPPGTIATGGGGGVSGVVPEEVALRESAPALSGGVPTGWLATAAEVTPIADTWSLTVYALCASV